MKHISAFARSHPDKVAYRMAGSGETLTFAQLDDLSNRGAQAFRALGVALGGSVALLFENRLDFLGLTWAAQRGFPRNIAAYSHGKGGQTLSERRVLCKSFFSQRLNISDIQRRNLE